MQPESPIISVSELTRRIKQALEIRFPSVLVQGEISNFKRHTSGHLYFTIKDEGAQISGVMWRSRAVFLSFQPEDGMKVVVSGRVSVYEVRGNYQIEALSIRPVGVGELQMAFEHLKRKLADEGLFDPERKKSLPGYPERIGIVTSPTGAVLHDMLNILRRRFPGLEIIVSPVNVQGPGAAGEIARAIDDFNEFGEVDLLIVARGGGSLEDLWAFNEEVVARALARSRLPTVSAVGHETDFTIADFVADLRAPTPSAAAELVVKDRKPLLEIVGDYWYSMHNQLLTMVRYRKENIQHLLRSHAFNKPLDLLRNNSQRIDELERGMASVINHRIALTRSGVDALRHRIHALDPGLTLKRGYAMVLKGDRIIGSSALLKADDLIQTRFHDGTVESIVK